jgi:hypothetical protein
MASSRYQVYGLERTYPDHGEFFFKVVLSARYFKHSHDINVIMVDSSGHSMGVTASHWGRKININFEIDDKTAEGVAHVYLLRGGSAQIIADITLWVVQP